MGGGELHQELKKLCINTDWKYAVFWKLDHQTRMMLTSEDAYCDDSSNWFGNTEDLVRLAVAKMSYRVYSSGEGLVGRVAASGKHIWISEHELVNKSCSLDEHFDRLKPQFTAGIRTIAVVAVAPYGVVQLGSLYTIAEDLKLVNVIKEIFLELQSSLMVSRECSPCVTDLSTSSSSVRFHEHVNIQDRNTEKNISNTWKTVKTINDHQESETPIANFIRSTPYNDQNWKRVIPTFSNSNNLESTSNESFKFPAGCELYEALGPRFCNQKNDFNRNTLTIETIKVDHMPAETMSISSVLTQRSGSENLLEAIVASVCCSDSDEKRSTSSGQPVKPHMRLQPPHSDVLTSERANVGKKRARPCESRKPRPRDRQLIQDRLKDLRQLVPNGSKCSIDSLLERTIKHMLFMQCVTKRTEKIDKCAEFKLKEQPSSHEHGSSWAMEVGNELKVCPMIVENIGINGQMLVEMMCGEHVDFLEITEAIRSLGLTILKGVTNAYGDKNRMCFVVEGENNRGIHRVDILLSLIQILESKKNT